MIGRIVGRLRRELSEFRARAHRYTTFSPAATVPILRVIAQTLGREIRRSPHGRIRIGIDIRPFYEPLTGVGWYLFHLLEELGKHPDLELLLFGQPMIGASQPALHVALPEGSRLVGFDVSEIELSRWSRPVATAAFPLLARATRCELFFGANYFLPRPLDMIAKKRVVTVHDLTYRRMPHLLQDETLTNLQQAMQREVARADRIICVSEATRSDLLQFYDMAATRAVAIPSGLTPLPARREPVPLPNQQYILFVSTIEPRKDLGTLLDAFERVASDGTWDGDLVVVGKIGWKSEDVIAKMKSMKHASRVHHLDYLSRPQLATVYSNASMFVLPSIYEGFGFTMLEAMSFGVPTIASRASSLPEVGGAAALYFPVGESAVLAHLIGLLTHDEELRHALSKRGRERAAAFTWTRAAVQTAAVFRSVARSA